MDIHTYERNDAAVIERFRDGDFDFVESVSEVIETEFFRYIQAKKILGALAQTYPSPSEKQEVPVWFYLTSNMSMRLHAVHGYEAYPYVIRCGGMINAFGDLGRKVTHPQTGDVTLECRGFNDKNHYDRQTPCDQDFLRKFSKRTGAEALQLWFNRDVVRELKKHKAFNAEGIFIGDGSYIFVPDNPRYEGSSRMLFDEHDHPVSEDAQKKMSRAQLVKCRWRRCYKLVSLIHTDRAGSFFLYAGLAVLPGAAHECPVLYDLVDQFVAAVGDGVMRRLILDRGFIDGAAIGRCKKEHGIDILIPLRANMDLYKDALGLLAEPDVTFTPYTSPDRPPVKLPTPAEKPEAIRRREAARQKTLRKQQRQSDTPAPPTDNVLVQSEVAGISGFSWKQCPLPLNLIVNRETYADGHSEIWMLMDTKPLSRDTDAAERRTEYGLRTTIEERHRQIKCFWDVAHFTSTALSMVVNQVVFVLLTYTLLQLYLLRQGRRELNRRTRSRTLDYLRPQDAFIIIYSAGQFAIITTLAYTSLLLTLEEASRVKVLGKTRQLQRELGAQFDNPRAP